MFGLECLEYTHTHTHIHHILLGEWFTSQLLLHSRKGEDEKDEKYEKNEDPLEREETKR